MEKDLMAKVMAFRVIELRCLLEFAGVNTTGKKKQEMQELALDLVLSNMQGHVARKIVELYHTLFYIKSYETRISSSSSRHFTASSSYAGASEKVSQGRSPLANISTQETTASSSSSNNKMLSVSLPIVPICPVVKFKRLPFYDVITELIKPTSLISNDSVEVQERTFPFALTPQQALEVITSEVPGRSYGGKWKKKYQVQVQLRFCQLDSTCEQTDSFPPSVFVQINGMSVSLPNHIMSNSPLGVGLKRPSKPLDVTEYVKLSIANTVSVTWLPDKEKVCPGWAMCLYLVKKQTSANLLASLKAKGPRPVELTQGMIKEIVSSDDGDCQIAMTSLKVSTACPLGMCRMTQPCRASTCSHLQCFDANLFLQMNEKKPTWTCPVCNSPILFENLLIDGYFLRVINSLSIDAENEIEVLPDGTWKPIGVIKKGREDGPPSKRVKTDILDSIIVLDDDEDQYDDSPGPSSSDLARDSSRKNNYHNKATKVVDVVDLTLSNSELEPQAKSSTIFWLSNSDSSSGSSAPAPLTSSINQSIQTHGYQKQNAPSKGSETNPVSKAAVNRGTSSSATITFYSASPSNAPFDNSLMRSIAAVDAYVARSRSRGHPLYGSMGSGHYSSNVPFDLYPWQLTPTPGGGSSSSSASALSHRRPSSGDLLLNPADNDVGGPSSVTFSLDSSSSHEWDTDYPLNESLDFNLDFLDYDQSQNNIASSSHSSDLSNNYF